MCSTWTPGVTTKRPSSQRVNLNYRVLTPADLAPYWLGATAMDFSQRPVLHGIQTAGQRNVKTFFNPLMPLVSRTEYESEPTCPFPTTPEDGKPKTDAEFDGRPFHGVLVPYDAYRIEQRPTPGFPGPGCAAPTGFLNLLTPYSTRNLPALFHAGNALGLRSSEDSPFQ